MKMMGAIQKLCESLPGIDCGSCGSPTCLAFAEDVIRGEAHEHDCIIKMKQIIHDRLKEQGD